VAEGLALPSQWHAAHRDRYAAARERLVRGLTPAGYAVLPADGTWFVTIDLAASGLPADDEAVAERMVREAGVAAIPVSAFYRDDPERSYLRLCFAKEDATLDEAVERLAEFRRTALPPHRRCPASPSDTPAASRHRSARRPAGPIPRHPSALGTTAARTCGGPLRQGTLRPPARPARSDCLVPARATRTESPHCPTATARD